MTAHTVERRRTGWDILVGVLLVLGGLVVLANAVAATAFSILLLGWFTLIAGVVRLVGAFFTMKSGHFWSSALGGAVLAVLGLFILRNPVVGVVGLTLLAGCLFLVIGVARIVGSSQAPEGRWLLVTSGLISAALGLFVLFNLAAASLALLGILLGVQILVEGVTLLVAGRLHPVRSPRPVGT